METVIIVSVLSTLCAVALVGSIVVLYRKSKSKVDVNELNDYRRDIDERFTSVDNKIMNEMEVCYRNIEELRKLIDSRCDKLHSLITSTSAHDEVSLKHKQILKS